MRGRLTFVGACREGEVDAGSDAYGRMSIYKLPSDAAEGDTVEFEVKRSCKDKPYATFIKKVARNTTIYNTEDRACWYGHGEKKENVFLSRVVPLLGIPLVKNPEKETKPWEIDFYDSVNKRYADLKTQETPFFRAYQYKYSGRPCNPRYTVTFNKKDYENYRRKHPDCDIYYWVNWKQLEYCDSHVERLYGVWKARFPCLASKIETDEVALHSYQNRKDDDHNARDSYLFDLTDTDVFERLL